MTMTEEHYLKKELYSRIQNDPKLLEWIEQGSLDGLWYWDLEDQENEWLSPQFMKTFGYEPGEIPHTSQWWQDNIFQEDLPAVLDNFDKHCADPNHPYDQIVRYRHKTGKTVWVRCRGLVMFNDQGQPSRMIGAHTDVSSLMETRECLESTAEELLRTTEINQLALSASNIGIWNWNIKNNTLSWDDGMFTLYRADKSRFSGQYEDWAQCVHTADLKNTEELLQASVRNKEKFDTVFRIVWPDDDIRYIHTSAKVFSDDSGQAIRVLGANWDVTEEKNREAELKRSNEELSAFAYAASHDLKSPLRSVKQLATWIEQDLPDVPEEVADNLHTMKNRISRMENLLNDLLGYSRIGREREQLKQEQVDTAELIRNIFEFLSPPSEYELRLIGEFPIMVVSRPPFEQVLRNLIGNAIKHRSRDSDSVTVWVSEGERRYQFHVGDSGTPIPAKYSEKIFDMFQTLKPKDELEGSGMGLAIAKKIIQNNRCKIGLHCHDTGSNSYSEAHECNNEFYFTWPRTPRA